MRELVPLALVAVRACENNVARMVAASFRDGDEVVDLKAGVEAEGRAAVVALAALTDEPGVHVYVRECTRCAALTGAGAVGAVDLLTPHRGPPTRGCGC